MNGILSTYVWVFHKCNKLAVCAAAANWVPIVRRYSRCLYSTGGNARCEIRLLIKRIICAIIRLIGQLNRISSRQGCEHSPHVRACLATSGLIRYFKKTSVVDRFFKFLGQ